MEDVLVVEEGIVSINKGYVREVTEFRKILERDRGSEGDAQGRKKLKARAEFLYIKTVASLFSYPNQEGRNEKEVHLAAIKEAGLPADYKADEDVVLAIEKFKEVELSLLPTLNTIHTLIRGLKLSDTVGKRIISDMETIIEIQQKKKDENPDAPVNIADEILTTKNLMDKFDDLVSMSLKLPKTLEALEKLEEKLTKEKSGVNMGRGQKKLGNRADPVR